MNITQVTTERWKQAQHDELLIWKNSIGDDDWNKWWAAQFDNYEFMRNRNVNSIAEIGCGPYAKNIQYVMSVLPNKPAHIMLNDPLINEYLADKKPVSKVFLNYGVNVFAKPLEEMDKCDQYDCVICINVLSHVYDVDKGLNNIYNMLKQDGVLIFGEDLTNESDLVEAPEVLTDVMHPIRFDKEFIKTHLSKYTPIYDKLLTKEQGRNPRAHYATVVFAGQKK